MNSLAFGEKSLVERALLIVSTHSCTSIDVYKLTTLNDARTVCGGTNTVLSLLKKSLGSRIKEGTLTAKVQSTLSKKMDGMCPSTGHSRATRWINEGFYKS